ncbi:Oidioi.mRNA.OKI2018_I69.XSR.g13930.t1.cds [Oikopleura dioica]|uniref:Oidioi.mRNA.OKI2018_I69.XSR.g13930.t1.cds n=1 Tax=Oikopleura dioica TaxID=34765 RepID=A0ABN7SC42_OIKDI|nr:Oidioi.mRNA.OKI2018_I69.XSR.g13930.t1.cds [Oikopleura dioica]
MDSTFPDYSGLGNSAGSYEVIENSPKRYRVRVPVTSDLFSSSANIIIKVNGQKVTVEAKIEATDAYGNKKISKICKDVTLPADCNMKTLKTQEENNAVIISVDKNEISQPDFVPLKERQAYEGRGVNSPWTLTGSSPSPRPSSQTDAFPQPPTQDEVFPEARAESRTRKHSKNVRFSEEPPKVTQVDTDEPPSPQVAQNKANQPTPKKKGIGRMDSNDFIMAEEEDVAASLRSLTLPVLEERPASIPPDEPIEDLGVFGGSTPQIEKPNPFIRPILQKPQDFIATNEPDPSIVPLKVVNDPPQRQMATKFPNYNTDPITRTAPSPYCPFPTDNAGFPPPPPCVTGAGSATTTFGTPLMPPPAYYDSTTTRRASVDIPVEHVDDA